MAFGAICRLGVVHWLLVLRDARLRVGIGGDPRLELGGDLAGRVTRSILYHGIRILYHGPWYLIRALCPWTKRSHSASERTSPKAT